MICPYNHKLDDLYNAKYKCMLKNNVIVWRSNDIKKYLDIFLMFIPELSLMENFKQNNPEHIYDVLDHTLVTMKCIEPKLELRLAMLLHDTGKPLTYTQDEEGIGHFNGHQIKSAEIARDILNRLR